MCNAYGLGVHVALAKIRIERLRMVDETRDIAIELGIDDHHSLRLGDQLVLHALRRRQRSEVLLAQVVVTLLVLVTDS